MRTVRENRRGFSREKPWCLACNFLKDYLWFVCVREQVLERVLEQVLEKALDGVLDGVLEGVLDY